MSIEKESPLERDELVKILAYALSLVAPQRGRETPDQSDFRRKIGAQAVADHFDLCGLTVLRGKGVALHKTPIADDESGGG